MVAGGERAAAVILQARQQVVLQHCNSEPPQLQLQQQQQDSGMRSNHCGACSSNIRGIAVHRLGSLFHLLAPSLHFIDIATCGCDQRHI